MVERVMFSQQVLPEQMAAIKAQGFQSVVNNRPDFEGGPDQPTSAMLEEAARLAGLDYVFQPVVGGQISQFDAEMFARHYHELPKPILMFCRTGNRSSTLYNMARELNALD